MDLDDLMRAIATIVGQTPATSTARPGETRSNGIGLRELLMPPGVFQIGSPESGADASPDEMPQRHVRIARPLWMTIAPITQREFESVTAA